MPVVEAGRGGKCVRRVKDGLGLENESIRSVWLTPSGGFSGIPKVQGKRKKDQKPFVHMENRTCKGRKIPDQISSNTYWRHKRDDVDDITGTESVAECHQRSKQASRKGSRAGKHAPNRTPSASAFTPSPNPLVLYADSAFPISFEETFKCYLCLLLTEESNVKLR